MRVRLGAPVIGKDSVEVGKVDRIVIDRKSLQIVQLIVKQGRILSKDRIIPREMANRVDDEGRVYLNLTSQEVDGAQEYFVTDYVPPNRRDDISWSTAIGTPIGGPVPMSDASTQYDNLPENVVVVEKGMDVNDRDSEKLGELEDIEFDANVTVTGFTVSSGRFNRKELRSFKVEQVAGVGVDYIRLNLTVEEARAIPQQSAD